VQTRVVVFLFGTFASGGYFALKWGRFRVIATAR